MISRCADKGIALFAVIWIALLISAIAMGFTRQSRVSVDIAQNETAAAEARLAARSAIHMAGLAVAAQMRGLSLAQPQHGADVGRAGERMFDPTRIVALNGAPYRWSIPQGEFDVTLRFQSEAGKIDLLTGDAGLLPLLLAELGIARPDRVARAIVRQRETDGLTRGVPWRLDDQGINALSDLTAIEGLSALDYARLKPFVTLYGRRASPDPLTASEPIFDALPLPDEERARLVQARADPAPPGPDVLFLTVTAEAARSEGGRAVEQALIRIQPDARPALRIIQWH